MKVVKGLFYSNDHEWVKVEGDKAYVGITDFAQHALGDIVFVELPDTDKTFKAGAVLGVVESVKAASDIYTPVSGVVLQVNEKLNDEPQLINADAYANYIAVLRLTNKDELNKLMNSDQYAKFTENK